MDIDIRAGRDVVNQWVEVTVKAGPGHLISHVTTNLDGFPIGDDGLAPAETSYQRQWHQVGTGTPNQTHVVVVTATDNKAIPSTASKTWQN
jgi:hypothetical protein